MIINSTGLPGLWRLIACWIHPITHRSIPFSKTIPPGSERALIPVIQDIQELYGYLPPELLTYVARKIGISEAKAYSVASFYVNFSFEAKGKYVIKVCDGTACHVRSSVPILEALYHDLGLSADKHTTDDMLFTVETVSCLGACGLAPALTINEQVYPQMSPDKIRAVIKELRGKEA